VFSCAAASEDEKCTQAESTTFITNSIFDLSDKAAVFIHNWANALHIKTKEKTLLNESAFFLNKCKITDKDLQELERHLRSKKYIRESSVTYLEDKKIKVETWDNWSLMPTVDFGRKGGQNKFAIGLKDRNLLGLGIDAEIEYFSDDQRTGYKFDTQFPLFLQNNINASIRLTRNDDGTSEAAFLQKKFVSFDTKNAYKIGFDNFNQIDTQYENGVESSQYLHNKHYTTASWHWLYKDSANDTLRFGLGYTADKHTFAKVTDLASINPTLTNTSSDVDLPVDRAFNYPFISIEYLEKDFRKLTNLNLINQIEDFNLGWNASANLGTDLSNNHDSPVLIWQSNLSKGVDLFDKSFLFFEASFEGELYDTKENKNRQLIKINTEYFQKFNNSWGGYFKNTNQLSKNQFADSPIVLGSETGVRGFPLQYQHGRHSTQFTFEARYYPHINIYKLLELGAAAFVDTGRVFGQSERSKNQSPWMTSVGLGARFYSTHSSESRVIHLDIIKPITSDPNVNSIEFRITTKHSF
jgi:hypothetical protein